MEHLSSQGLDALHLSSSVTFLHRSFASIRLIKFNWNETCNCFFLQVNISMLVRYLLQIIGSLAIMFAVSPKLTGVLLAVVPIVAIGAQRYGRIVSLMRLSMFLCFVFAVGFLFKFFCGCGRGETNNDKVIERIRNCCYDNLHSLEGTLLWFCLSVLYMIKVIYLQVPT